jgi:hypothetical protein
MISTHDILSIAWPNRGGWRVCGDQITAGDGGPVPTMEEIEAARPAAEIAYAAHLAATTLANTRANLILTRAQFGEMLIRKGLKGTVLAAIAAIPDSTTRDIMTEWFEYAPTVRRTSPKVEAIRQQLFIDADDVDAWFVEAMTYE